MYRKLFGTFLAAFLAVLVACETVPEQAEVEDAPVVESEPVVAAPVEEREAAQVRRDAIGRYNLQSYSQPDFNSGERAWESGEAAYEQDNDSARASYIRARGSYDDVIATALTEIEQEKRTEIIAARRRADMWNAGQATPLQYNRAETLVERAIEARDADNPVAAVAFADRARDSFQFAAIVARRLSIDGVRDEANDKRRIVNSYDLSTFARDSYSSAESSYNDAVATSDNDRARQSYLAAIRDYDDIIATALDRIVAGKRAEVRRAWNRAVSLNAESRTPILFGRARLLIDRAQRSLQRGLDNEDERSIVTAVVLANRARNSLQLASARIELGDELYRLVEASASERRAIVTRYNLSVYARDSYRSAESNYNNAVAASTSDGARARQGFLAAIVGYDEVIGIAIDSVEAEKRSEVQAEWDRALSLNANTFSPDLFDRARALISRAQVQLQKGLDTSSERRIVAAAGLADQARDTLRLAGDSISSLSLRERAESALNSVDRSLRDTQNRALELVENYNTEFNADLTIENVEIGDDE